MRKIAELKRIAYEEAADVLNSTAGLDLMWPEDLTKEEIKFVENFLQVVLSKRMMHMAFRCGKKRTLMKRPVT
jgi:hypothetical protein